MGGKNYDKLLLFVAVVVTVIWGIGFIVQTIWPSRQTPDSVNQVMVIVATGLFAGSVISNVRRNGKDDDDDKNKDK